MPVCRKRARHNFTRFVAAHASKPQNQLPTRPYNHPLKTAAPPTGRARTHSSAVCALTFTLLARSCLPNICCTLRAAFVFTTLAIHPAFHGLFSIRSLSLSLFYSRRLSLSLFTLLSLSETRSFRANLSRSDVIAKVKEKQRKKKKLNNKLTRTLK